MKRSLSSATHGFSLIEVMVSIVILSLGIIGLVGLQARAMQYSASAEDTNRAALLANEIAAQMWLAGNISITPAMKAAWQAKVQDPSTGGLPNGSGDITITGQVATIKITWQPPGASSVNQYSTDLVVQ